jgi:hypothetical protein
MDAETADPQRDAPEVIKQDAQHTTKETSAAQPDVEATNAPLLTWNAVVRVLADIEAKPAAAIAAVAVVLVLSLFGRVGSLVVGLLGGLLIHAATERKRDAIQYRTRERELAFAPESESVVLHAREAIPPLLYCMLTKVVLPRHYPPQDEPRPPLLLGPSDPGLCRLVVHPPLPRQ